MVKRGRCRKIWKKKDEAVEQEGEQQTNPLAYDGNHMLMAAIEKLISHDKHIKEKISACKHMKS